MSAREPEVNLALARSFGLTEREYEGILKGIGRIPTYAELGVCSVMYSEHCSYKSSRVHLGRLPTKGPKVVQGPGENAGAVDIGDGFCAVFKMESHNHPSFIAPYQGAATGVGGILRDVFTMGARPVASLNSLRFGRPDHPRTRELMQGVVKGIGDYGNCMGVPTVGGELYFDKSYDGNILVNAFTVGIARIDSLFFGKASGIGNPVFYVGSKTGRDGIHGATMASAEFDEKSEKKLPTVQVGDPFVQKLLLEACLEIFARDCLEGVQDMGAAGLTSSSVEMASRAGNGLELDLDAIPRRTQKLTPYEMLLSESQERMLMVSKPGREQDIFDVCAKWDLDVAIVGRVTDSGRFVCRATPGYDPLDERPCARDPQVVVDVPIAMLVDAAPRYDRPQREVPRDPIASRVIGPTVEDVGAELLALIGAPNIGSRAWVYRQYDHVVRDGTVWRPGQADAALIRVFCEDGERTIEKFLALSVDCNARHVQLDPYMGAAMAVAECARNLACVGATALGLTDCLNFGNPEKPETMWRFSRSIDGIRDACLALDVPVVSGNVSLYNETEGQSILPTPTVAIVGQLERREDMLGMAFRDGHTIALLGSPARGALGGSEWLTSKVGEVTGEAVGIDLAAEARLQRLLVQLAKKQLLASAHDVSDGGLAVCIAESCIAGQIGCALTLGLSGRELAKLWSEEPSRVVVSFDASNRAAIESACREADVPFSPIGMTGGDALTIDASCRVAVSELARAHRAALDPIVGADA
ncbi:MAG TPA: phosphoribosylformylglycinamidine synthase subunit PurL [Polyangiales bacterium]|jgi:phosphoribosylformylglycinamidine synthase|nr:phosphoribosylformylglycinamidine synthase subunit PurL [Polyangiales bacterium]